MRALSIIATVLLLVGCGESNSDKPSASGMAAGGGGATSVGGTSQKGSGTSATGGTGVASSTSGKGTTGGTQATGGSNGSGGQTGGSRATGGSTGSYTGGTFSVTSTTGGANTGGTRATGGLANTTGGASGGSSATTGGRTTTGGSTATSSSTGGTNSIPSTNDPNVVAVTVDPGPTGQYLDGIFASVTFCVPNTTTCQTIDHLLVDTGSVGIRVLESKVTLKLPVATGSSGKNLAECLPFLSGTSWGPVRLADIKIGNESAKNLKVQLIGESTYPLPADCSGTPNNDPETLGSNGVLGVGINIEDCGSSCNSRTANPGLYYECSSSSVGGCTVAMVPTTNQLTNPIAGFAEDNNGSIIQLQAIPEGGAASATGLLVFGIGTRANNQLGSAKLVRSDAYGMVSTTFPAGGKAYASIIDSGSNGLYFLDSTTTKLAVCSSGAWKGFYCPQTTTALKASMAGSDGSAVPVDFNIINPSKASAQYCAFNDVGAPMTNLSSDPSTPSFDWGLPFYFGRNVFTAIETKTTPAGTGPYFAF